MYVRSLGRHGEHYGVLETAKNPSLGFAIWDSVSVSQTVLCFFGFCDLRDQAGNGMPDMSGYPA